MALKLINLRFTFHPFAEEDLAKTLYAILNNCILESVNLKSNFWKANLEQLKDPRALLHLWSLSEGSRWGSGDLHSGCSGSRIQREPEKKVLNWQSYNNWNIIHRRNLSLKAQQKDTFIMSKHQNKQNHFATLTTLEIIRIGITFALASSPRICSLGIHPSTLIRSIQWANISALISYKKKSELYNCASFN